MDGSYEAKLAEDWFEIPGSENEVSVGVTLIKSIIITQAKCAGAVWLAQRGWFNLFCRDNTELTQTV